MKVRNRQSLLVLSYFTFGNTYNASVRAIPTYRVPTILNILRHLILNWIVMTMSIKIRDDNNSLVFLQINVIL